MNSKPQLCGSMTDIPVYPNGMLSAGPRLTICVPVYQNAGSLPGLVDEILMTFSVELPELDLDILFVNDGSTDGSANVLADLAKKHPDKISVVTFTRNFGQLFALIAGIDYARGDAVICVSADQQDPISVAAAMARSWLAGHEVVVAHREGRDDGFGARFYSRLAYGFLRLSTPLLPKGGFDYFLLGKRAAANIRAQGNRNRFFPTDILALGYKTAFIPYKRRARVHGKSQYTFLKKIRSLIDAVVDSSYLPIRIMSSCGAIFVAVGIVYAISVAIARLNDNVPGNGYAVIVILLLMIGGLIISMLGVLGEYIWRIYDELRGKPLYLVDQVVGRAANRNPPRPLTSFGGSDHKQPRHDEIDRD